MRGRREIREDRFGGWMARRLLIAEFRCHQEARREIWKKRRAIHLLSQVH